MAGENLLEPSIQDIREAKEFLKGKIINTPIECSSTYSVIYGAPLYFKLENFQKTGSFKTRGALFKISKLSESEKKHGVIACSAGNHAQGVAYASRLAGVSSKIVMPSYTISAKINAVKSYGAEVILYGNSYSEAFSEAKRLSEIESRTFIDGFNDRWIISGQGTIGLEILEAHPDVQNVIIPVGGGGLISGIAKAIKSEKPEVRIIGVQSENCDSVVESVKKGEYTVSNKGFTIADGISV
ncbi:MAG: threonine/serine dehydratase, partial [Thermoplasmataceae archaeon]